MTRAGILLLLLLTASGVVLWNLTGFGQYSAENIHVESGEDAVGRDGGGEAASEASRLDVLVADEIELPLSGSAPTTNVQHAIPIEEIRQGCFRQDCIPSVDEPVFMSTSAAREALPDDAIGIGLSYKGEDRFYPFAMLVTREIVNDVVADDPLLVTYCPLCGTGIVFDRSVDGVVQEFGVSGMLWQSNLLMYNRADDIVDRNLWSQVLGEAVVGARTGQKLSIVQSDIVQLGDWAARHPGGRVLDIPFRADPYDGNYYGVASRFGPSFDETTSPLDPSTSVYGIEVNGIHKAYLRDALPTGTTTDKLAGETIVISNDKGKVTFQSSAGNVIPDIEGYWFSWVAAHPDTELWTGE